MQLPQAQEMTSTDGPAEPSAQKENYQPASTAILNGVRELILSGEIAPGEPVRQEALAKRFKVSRIPVREALRQLESEGLVNLVPHSGARVARLDFEEYQELYRMREALEPLIISQSAEKIDDERLVGLYEAAAAIEDATDDLDRWLALDRTFHLQTYEPANLPRAQKLAIGFWNQTQQYRRAFIYALPDRERRLEIVDLEHRLILDALRRSDPVDAAEKLRSHIRRTRLDLASAAHIFEAPVAPS